MPTVNIPDKICPHCGGTTWCYEPKVNRYTCVKKKYECWLKWRLKNLEKFRKSRRDYYNTKVDKALHYQKTRQRALSLPEITREYKRKYSNKPEAKLKKKEYKKLNPELHQISSFKYKNKIKSTLADTYIKDLICQDTLLSYKDVPQDLIELKRKQISLLRKIS